MVLIPVVIIYCKMSMWQSEDDMSTCDVAEDVDVSFHMLSHKVRGTKIKKTKFAKGPNLKIHRKLHVLQSSHLLHDLQHILIKLRKKPKNSSTNINITTLEIHLKFLRKPHFA